MKDYVLYDEFRYIGTARKMSELYRMLVDRGPAPNRQAFYRQFRLYGGYFKDNMCAFRDDEHGRSSYVGYMIMRHVARAPLVSLEVFKAVKACEDAMRRAIDQI